MQAGAHSLAIPDAVAVADPIDTAKPAAHPNPQPVAERDRRTQRSLRFPSPLVGEGQGGG